MFSWKHRSIIWPNNSTLGHKPKRSVNRFSNKNLYLNIHGILIVNSQEMETMQMSTASWINKTWHIHLLFSHKNKWNTDTHYNIDEPWKQCKWKKADKRSNNTWFYLCEMFKIGTFTEIQTEQWFLETEWKGNGEWLFKRYGVSFRVKKKF